MAGNKYLKLSAGRITEQAASDVSTGVSDAGKLVALGTDGRLDPTVMPTGIGADTAAIEASEALSAGDFVNIWNDAGTAKVRKADASTTGKEAHGFVLDAFSSGQNATVYFEGRNTALTTLTAGTRQYLSASTAGQCTATPPSAAGNVVQFLGNAISPTSLTFEATDGIVVA